MTCTKNMEADARMYWRVVSDTRRSLREGPTTPDEIAEAIDDLNVIALYTECPSIRHRCQNEMQKYLLMAEPQVAIA